MALIRFLPAEGATYRAEAGWSDLTTLLAVVVEQLDALTRLTYSAHSGKSAPWDPIHVPRPVPSGPAPPRRPPTAEEMASMFGR